MFLTSKFSPHLWLTTQRDFQAKMGKTAENAPATGIAISPVRRPDEFAVLPPSVSQGEVSLSLRLPVDVWLTGERGGGIHIVDSHDAMDVPQL